MSGAIFNVEEEIFNMKAVLFLTEDWFFFLLKAKPVILCRRSSTRGGLPNLFNHGFAFVPRLSTIPTEYINSNAILNCWK
jgi:hypothetical protein